MTTTLAAQPDLEALRLDLPMIAAMRVHQTRTLPQPSSGTDREALWLADLDCPVKLSRWANPFRQVELGVFTPELMATHKRAVLDACAVDTGRVLMLANPSPDSTTPRAFWVLDAAGHCVAQAVHLLPHLDERGILSADPVTGHMSGRLSTCGGSEEVVGRLNSYLGPDGVRLGIQLTSPAGEPLLTVSMSGQPVAASPRELMHAATALAA